MILDYLESISDVMIHFAYDTQAVFHELCLLRVIDTQNKNQRCCDEANENVG